MSDGETREVLLSLENKSLWITEGLPPMQNGVLMEIPRSPHTFRVNQLDIIDMNGNTLSQLFNIGVVLTHGSYNPETHRLEFGNGDEVKPIVMAYNDQHQDTPIKMIVACSGNQVSPNYGTHISQGEDDAILIGMFAPSEGIAYSMSTDLGVTLTHESGHTHMVVTQKDPGGFFMNLEQLEGEYGVESQISIND